MCSSLESSNMCATNDSSETAMALIERARLDINRTAKEETEDSSLGQIESSPSIPETTIKGILKKPTDITVTNTSKGSSSNLFHSIFKSSFRRKKSKHSSRNLSSVKSLSVHFEELQVRTFPQILGDHPYCSKGLPLSLGWDHSSEQTFSLDDYESSNERNRAESISALRISEFRRLEILRSAVIQISNDDKVTDACQSSSLSHTSLSQNVKLSPSVSYRCDLATAAIENFQGRSAKFSSKGPCCPTLNIDIDGNDVQHTDAKMGLSSKVKYTEVELKRAERRMCRERERRMGNKRKSVRMFFDNSSNQTTPCK